VLAKANSALLAIAAEPRVAALSAIAVAANVLLVLQQRHELQRCRSHSNVTSCNAAGAARHRSSSELQHVASLAAAASCNVLPPSPRHCVLALPLAIVELCSFDFCRTFVGRSSDFRQTFVGLPSNVRPSCVLPTSSSYVLLASSLTSSSYVLLTSLLTSSSYILLMSSTWRPVPCYLVDLTSCTHVLRDTVLQSCVLHIVVVHLVVLCLVAYLVAFCRTTVLRLGRFKPYIVLKFCN
jgi:hypothetical protein